MSALPPESGHCFKQEARATTRASNNKTLGAGNQLQAPRPYTLVTPVLRGSTVASVTF
jgi:hypothetical protein